MYRIVHLNSLRCDITNTDSMGAADFDDERDAKTMLARYIKDSLFEPGDTLEIRED